MFILFLSIFSLIHISLLNNLFYVLKMDDLEYLKILQYLVSAILISNIFIWNKINKLKSLNKIILIILGLYAFIIRIDLQDTSHPCITFCKHSPFMESKEDTQLN